MNGKISVGRGVVPTTEQFIEIMTGSNAQGPKRCLFCQEQFNCGEIWLRYTSPRDPKYGSYSLGVHEKCRLAKFQKSDRAKV